MTIDNNELEKTALSHFRKGEDARGHELQDRFVDEVNRSIVDHCSCTVDCKYPGRCRECVVIHRGHQDHLPNCFHGMVNDRIRGVSSLTEHSFRN